MSSFTRTIPSEKRPAWVQEVLSHRDHFVPLTFRPAEVEPGDHIYLIFRGQIIGRAKILAIEPAGHQSRPRPPRWARWVVRYVGSWEKPPRLIPAQGHQGIRYLHAQALQHLDRENW